MTVADALGDLRAVRGGLTRYERRRDAPQSPAKRRSYRLPGDRDPEGQLRWIHDTLRLEDTELIPHSPTASVATPTVSRAEDSSDVLSAELAPPLEPGRKRKKLDNDRNDSVRQHLEYWAGWKPDELSDFLDQYDLEDEALAAVHKRAQLGKKELTEGHAARLARNLIRNPRILMTALTLLDPKTERQLFEEAHALRDFTPQR